MTGWFATLPLLWGCRSRMPPPDINVPDDPSQQWEQVLNLVVTQDGVDYDRLERERRTLDRFVAWLALEKPPVKLTNTRHALWLNAYNALVLWQILETGRPESAWAVDGWMPVEGSGFFYETEFLVDEEWLSLAEIQHERIRMRNMDLRDHAAIACPARSCPPLRNELYRNTKITAQLKDQMRAWVNHPTLGVRVEDGVAVLPALWDEYGNDFDFWSGRQDLCMTAASYAGPLLQADLSRLSEAGCPHRFEEWDGSLNDASRRNP